MPRFSGLSFSNHTDSFFIDSLKTVGEKSKINMSMEIFVTLIDKNVFQSYMCVCKKLRSNYRICYFVFITFTLYHKYIINYSSYL